MLKNGSPLHLCSLAPLIIVVACILFSCFLELVGGNIKALLTKTTRQLLINASKCAIPCVPTNICRYNVGKGARMPGQVNSFVCFRNWFEIKCHHNCHSTKWLLTGSPGAPNLLENLLRYSEDGMSLWEGEVCIGLFLKGSQDGKHKPHKNRACKFHMLCFPAEIIVTARAQSYTCHVRLILAASIQQPASLAWGYQRSHPFGNILGRKEFNASLEILLGAIVSHVYGREDPDFPAGCDTNVPFPQEESAGASPGCRSSHLALLHFRKLGNWGLGCPYMYIDGASVRIC